MDDRGARTLEAAAVDGRPTRARCRSSLGGLPAYAPRPVLVFRAAPAFFVDGEAVVVAGDLDPARVPVDHGLVHPAMAESELVGLAPERQRKELVPEADPEHGDPAEELTDGFDAVRGGRGVTGAVRQEHAVEA